MGGRNLRLRDVPIVRGSPRIVIRGFAVMGSIDVVSRSEPLRPAGGPCRLRGHAQPGRPIDARSAPGANPIDLAALGRDIRREIREQHRSARHGSRRDPPGVPDPPKPPVAAASPDPEPPASGASPAPAPFATDGTVTILFCDMVDYAGMTERLGDQASRQLLHDHHRIVRDALARHDGREINVQGDGFMVAFGGVARALRCAVDIQRAISAYVPRAEDETIAVHIGVHTGDAVAEGDDFLGQTVIVASRLADAAGPGEILGLLVVGATRPGLGRVHLRRPSGDPSEGHDARPSTPPPLPGRSDQVGTEAWQKAGLYDPREPDADERLALLEYLTERGATIEQMVEAHRQGVLPSVAGDLVTQGRTHLIPVTEIAERSGVPVERVLRVLLAAGIPAMPETEVSDELVEPDGGVRAGQRPSWVRTPSWPSRGCSARRP